MQNRAAKTKKSANASVNRMNELICFQKHGKQKVVSSGSFRPEKV